MSLYVKQLYRPYECMILTKPWVAIPALLFLLIGACATRSTSQVAMYCPAADALRASGAPGDFEFMPNGELNEQDYAQVTDFDAVRLDPVSAEIIGQTKATANYAYCLYGLRTAGSPFYLIRTMSAGDQTRIQVDFKNSNWGGFCWAPDDEQDGCVVVCHLDVEKCPFSDESALRRMN